MKKMFTYETHLHTCQGSACAVSSAEEYILPYIKKGYSGIFVTDHFWGGNTCVSRELSWEQWVDSYCSGYELALKKAHEINLKNGTLGTENEFRVFFGFEQTFRGDDYLVYGLNKQWLYKHPEVVKMKHKELFEAVNAENGLMIQAHPFRLRDYMDSIHLHPREVHGVEIFNAGNKPQENELAELYAKKYDFPVTSGTDIHNSHDVLSGKTIGGVSFEQPLMSIDDYCILIKNKQGTVIK